MGDVRTFVIQQVIGIWHRRWYALAVAWLVCILGWTVVISLPDEYRSEARIYIDTSSLLGPLLRGIAVQTDLQQEVAIMQRTLLSRPNLEEVARATDLDLNVTTPEEMEQLLRKLEGNASIRAQARNLFTVAYNSKDPVLAKSVVQALLTIFVESNLGKSRQDMESARSFIETQLQAYERQLREAEQRRAEFKRRHADILAGGDFTGRLANAKEKLKSARYRYEDALGRMEKLQAQLAATPRFLEVQQPQTQIYMDGNGRSVNVSRLREAEQNLTLLKMRFTENHPDVKAAERSIEHLEALIAEEQAQNAAGEGVDGAEGPPKAQIPNALYEQLQFKINDLETEIATLQRNVAEAEADVERLEEMRSVAPTVEAQLIDLDRDYGILKAKFEEFLARREAAKISQAAEASSDAVQFRIISPPQVPIFPAGPNRMLLIGLVLVVGIGAGGGFAFLLAQIDETYRMPEPLMDGFGLPVLGVVHRIVSAKERARKFIGHIGFGLAIGSLIAVGGTLLLLAPRLSLLSKRITSGDLPPELLWLTYLVNKVSGYIQF